MFLNVWNKKTCQNQVLLLSLFSVPYREVEVFLSQNFYSRLKKVSTKTVRYKEV